MSLLLCLHPAKVVAKCQVYKDQDALAHAEGGQKSLFQQDSLTLSWVYTGW